MGMLMPSLVSKLLARYLVLLSAGLPPLTSEERGAGEA